MSEVPLLDGRQLQLIDLLHRTASVTRTAEKLGQTQPTVSLWLARLREQLGDPLFVRTAQGMLPTPRAQELIGTVRTVLAGLQSIAEPPAAFDAATMQRSFRIFMTDASHITLLPQLFSHVRGLAPGVTLEAATIHAGMAAELEAGTADLALGFIPELEAGFYQQTFYDQDWVCLAHTDHPRIRPKSFGLKEYSREAHVGVVHGTGVRLLESAVKRLEIERHVVLNIPGFLGLPAILSTTDLIATLPRHIGETLARIGGLRVLRCPVPVPGFSVRQHWHARFHQDPGNRWLRGICAELFVRRRHVELHGRKTPDA